MNDLRELKAILLEMIPELAEIREKQGLIALSQASPQTLGEVQIAKGQLSKDNALYFGKMKQQIEALA